MITNFLKITIRNLLKHKGYSVINILGLAIGLACTIVILAFIQNELSVDAYHVNRKNIAQAYLKATKEDNTNYQSTTSPYIGPMLKNEYPEVIDAVRMRSLQEVSFFYQDKLLLESKGVASDENVFDIFSFSFLAGDPKTALSAPHSMVLTESIARKYFGEQSPISKIIRVDDQYDFMVTAVIEDMPYDSFRTFDFLIPLSFLEELGFDITGRPFFPCNYLTFVLLKENISLANLNEKISERLLSEGKEITFDIALKPFTEVYFFETGGITRITIMGLVAVMILALACINFINLATARALVRAKEIGVRKVTGAPRMFIALQFIGESIFLSFLSSILALILAQQFLPIFNGMTNRVTKLDLSNPTFLISLIVLIFITGLLAGIYPSIYLSRIQPVTIMKNRVHSAKATLRKALIVFQFVLSIAFILCTLIISRQTSFMQNFNLGVNKNNILYIQLEGDVKNKYSVLKTELLKHPNISVVSAGSNLPTAIRSGSYFQWGIQDETSRRICTTFTTYDYLETFDIKLIDGRYFSPEHPNDEQESIVVNEAAIKKIGLESPVGKPFYYRDKYYTLIGIIKDFHHNQLLSHPPEPLAFFQSPQINDYLFIKIDPNIIETTEITKTVYDIQSICQSFSPARPLRYQFYSDFSFQSQQLQDIVKQLFFISTGLAIFISCLGLFGLISFLNEQKTKEVGIRKVLGASVASILGILTRDLAKWILIANLIAWPIAWIAMRFWLQNFAYRIRISWWMFGVAGALALIVALLTVSLQTFKAAHKNPIESLRYE